jgi:hypothetical protein
VISEAVDWVRHLETHGCVLLREGASVYYNPAAQRAGAVARHREIKHPTAARIGNSVCLIRCADALTA